MRRNRVRSSSPKIGDDFCEAVVREGADELTLRGEEEEGMLRTFVDTTNVGDSRWEPPPVDEDWHAMCQAMFAGVEGPDHLQVRRGGKNGRLCTTSTLRCTKRSTSRSRAATRKQRRCGR